MIRIPCRNGYTALSAISFLFLCVSAIGISMTLNTESIPFFKQNENILIPFLSTTCGIFGLLLIFTFLDIQLFSCFRCCVNEYSPTEDIENNPSLYGDNIGTIASQPKENDPLLYPNIYPNLSERVNIPIKSKRTHI
jgi:hypothetical protein